MPWQKRWPPYVSQRVIDDQRQSFQALERASDDLHDSAQRAIRTHEIADRMAEARRRNHFSESMEALFRPRTEPRHQPRGTPT